MQDTETALALERFNKRTAARFAEVGAELEPLLSPSGLDAWADQILAIASSGWHAFGSADAYIDLSESLARAEGEAALLDVGRFGLSLAGFSYEPGLRYFEGTRRLVEAGRRDRSPVLESAGREIRAQFPHASSLITDFFRTGFGIALSSSLPAVEQWARGAVAFSDDRTRLIAFFAATRDSANVNWQLVDELREMSTPAALAWLEALPRVGPLTTDTGFESVLRRLAERDADFTCWLDAIDGDVVALDQPSRETLWQAMSNLPTASLCLALLSARDRLPLHRRDIVMSWVDGAQKFLPLQTDAATGYLALESAGAERALEKLRGQVNFEDVHRVLQLFAEAVSGSRLIIEPTDDETGDFRDLPSTDGLSIRLPRSIALYRAPAENFTVYKIALLHQLGYYEFGTFAYGRDGSVGAFRQLFRSYDEPVLAERLFRILEDARIDWALEHHYPGAAVSIERLKADAAAAMPPPASLRELYINALVSLSLDADPAAPDEYAPDIEKLAAHIARLQSPEADVVMTADVLRQCYAIISATLHSDPLLAAEIEAEHERDQDEQGDQSDQEEARDNEVLYRGRLEPDRARINQQLANLEPEDIETGDGEETMDMLGEVDPRDLRIEKLKKGEVQNAIGTMLADLDVEGGDDIKQEFEDDLEPFRGLISEDNRPADDLAFRYDEWDDVISDYRRRWCTLYETRRLDEKPEYVHNAMRELRSVASSVRRQLTHLRPELLRKVKGVEHGEELDLERTIEAVIDRRSGRSPNERIYVQRVRKERDVSALFLLDMSASTDDRIGAVETAPPAWETDDFLHDGFDAGSAPPRGKRIIDVEKEAVILMAEALEDLGDSYAICGFSGYGREQVDFYLCKDFTEPYNQRVKGRIGGIKPCRSTRMGPAIRHATRRLSETESRTKALIIISDGYPQDFDYGKDRNSKDYGIRDTTMALTEARRKGVQPFCLTVDPSGHDYLREMCPDQQYMVIQEIDQLPDELSKVYRSLTA